MTQAHISHKAWIPRAFYVCFYVDLQNVHNEVGTAYIQVVFHVYYIEFVGDFEVFSPKWQLYDYLLQYI